jgi:transcriptional regulator with XRE-family HTH domain
MPPRQFDGRRVRAARRGKDISQKQLGAGVGVSGPAVARWENGEDFPPGEKLPALAAALGEPIDFLFPRDGLPDLADLRCDAGYSQTQAAEIIGTSRVPLSNAERGRRKLNDAYVEPLANAYGVAERELLAAQDRSFGIPTSAVQEDEQALIPRTVGGKINYLLENAYFGQAPPTDEEIALAINEQASATVATAEDVRALRTGTETFVSGAVRAGLAHAFQVEPVFFEDGAEVNPAVREVLEGIRFLGSIQRGQILGLAARGNNAGLSTEMIAKINELVAELQDKLPERAE